MSVGKHIMSKYVFENLKHKNLHKTKENFEISAAKFHFSLIITGFTFDIYDTYVLMRLIHAFLEPKLQ